jgi:hypothetical protein
MVMLVFPGLLLGVGFLRVASGWNPYLLLGLNAVMYSLVLCPMFFIGKLFFYNDLVTMLERGQPEKGPIQEGVTAAKQEVGRGRRALARTLHSGQN